MVSLFSALVTHGITYVVVVKLIRPKELWWFAVCVPLVILFLWLAFWVMPLQSGNLVLAGVQWGFFGVAMYSFDKARKYWPEGW